MTLRTTKKEQYEKFIRLNCTLIELISLRFRLINAASECELLTSVYKQQLDVMSIDQSHLYLRFVQFEFAQTRNLTNEIEREPSQTADGRLDKITGQQYLSFAIQELEEGPITRLNFRQKDQWLTFIHESDDSLSNFRMILRLQLLHNHFLRTAVVQHRLAIVCITQQLQSATNKEHSEQNEPSSSLSNNVLYENTRRKIFRENYFLSIQFEKSPFRDRMLSEFLRQRDLKPMQYQQPREAEKLKRTLIHDFIDRLHQRNSILLLRSQILQSYLSLTSLIQQFPLTSRTHFMWSKQSPLPLANTTSSTGEKQESNSSTPVLTDVVTSNGYRSRAKQLLNDQGTELSNLWYLPSFLEQLTLFKGLKLEQNEFEKRLKDVLRIVSSLNDLVHIVVAYAQLNNAEQRCKVMSIIR